MKILKNLEEFETHHKILFFLIVMILTIFITRGIILIKNPNPAIAGFELHHFDYGLILLILSFLLLVFSKTRKKVHLILGAIAIGLIVDDIWFIRKSVLENQSTQTAIYNSTFSSVLILTIIITLILFLINHYSYKKKKY